MPKRAHYDATDLVGDWSRPWFLGEEVYSLVFADDDDSRLLEAINEIYDYPGWGGGGFVTTDAESRRYRDSYEIERESLDRIAPTITEIVCGAYDGEGYLIWTPD